MEKHQDVCGRRVNTDVSQEGGMEKSSLHHWGEAMVLDCAREQGKSVLVENVIHTRCHFIRALKLGWKGRIS